MKTLLLSMLGVLLTLPSALARDFDYTYEGQTLTYTVIDEDAKTCQTKAGDSAVGTPGNNVSGSLVIPSVSKDGDVEYAVTSIGSRAFWGCSGLTEVICENPTAVSAESSIFSESVYESATLFVPQDSKDEYMSTVPWSSFRNITEIEMTGIDAIGSDEAGAGIDYAAPYEVYNLSGKRIGTSRLGLTPGIYIVRQGSKVAKIALN